MTVNIDDALARPINVVGGLLLVSLLVVPTTYTAVKALVLAVTLSLVIAQATRTRTLPLDAGVASRTLMFAAAGSAFVLIGVFKDAPGALFLAPLYVGWPLVYAVLLIPLALPRRIQGIYVLLAVGAGLIGIQTSGYLLNQLGIGPAALYVPLEQGASFTRAGGLIEYNLYSITSLVFLVPFLVGWMLFHDRVRVLPKWVVAGLLALTLILVVLSGRRALLFVVGLSPLVAMAYGRWLPPPRAHLVPRDPRLWLGLLLALAGVAWLVVSAGVDLASSLKNLSQAFDFTSAEGQARGPAQFNALIAGFLDSPLVGGGLGATVPEVIRSSEQPWAFELSYVALLYHTGILGIGLYAYGLMWVLVETRRLMKDGRVDGALAIPILTGTTCFLLANATNPYLAKFDSLWVIFLPIAMLNCWRLATPATTAAPNGIPERV